MVNPTYKDPYVMSYNLTLEQSLGGQWVVDAACVGNNGRQIPGSYNMNAGMIAGAGAAGQPEYANFKRTSNTQLIYKGTNSNYNSLQARLTHHFSDGLVWTSAYSYQKAMGYISNADSPSTFDFYIDFQRNCSLPNYNSTHTYAQSFVYELPFGHGKRYVNRGLVSKLIGGWQLSDVVSARTGTPLLFTASAAQLNAPSNIQVPNQNGAFTKLRGIGTTRSWFNTSTFSTPVWSCLRQYGTERLQRTRTDHEQYIHLPQLSNSRGHVASIANGCVQLPQSSNLCEPEHGSHQFEFWPGYRDNRCAAHPAVRGNLELLIKQIET